MKVKSKIHAVLLALLFMVTIPLSAYAKDGEIKIRYTSSTLTFGNGSNEGLYEVPDFDAAVAKGKSLSLDVVTKDLVAYWNFDNCDATDDSGNGNNGTIQGNPECVAGIKGKTFEFDGADDHMEVTDSPILDIKNQITVAHWFKITTPQVFTFMISKGLSPGTFVWATRVDTPKSLYFDIRTANHGTKAAFFYGSDNLNDGKWHHIAGTFDGLLVKIYLDGCLKATQDIGVTDTLATNNEMLTIGSMGNQHYFDGTIDEVRIYNRVLYEAEIKELYAQGQPWSIFHHDAQHTGRSPYEGPQENTVLWTYTTGGEINSSPAIDKDGIIYVGSEDYKLYTIKPDGTLKWTYSIGGGIYSSPAIGNDGTIYVGSWDHNLYAINPDGTEKWRYSMGGGVQSSPVIADDGTIYVGSYDRQLYALNPDGTLKCTYSAIGAIGSSPAIGQDGIVYVGSINENRLHAVYPDCTLKWKTEGHSNVIGSSPALSPDGTVVYYGSDDGYLHARNTSDGSLKWKSPFTYGGIQSSPAIGIDGTIYVGTQYGSLWAINPTDGSLIWDHYTTLSAWSSPAIGADGTIYFATNYGHIYAMNPDGSEKWIYEGNYANDGHFQSSPAIGSDGALYIGSTNGMLYAFAPFNAAETFPQRVSVASDGSEGNNISYDPSISADGRYVAFASEATNLVSGDTNGVPDVFVHDRTTGQTTRVSVASDGSEGNSSSYDPSISADGRYVAFASAASNLVPGDTNYVMDIFIHDRTTGQTTRVSVALDGSQVNSASEHPSISADGRYVAFTSYASNLVPGDTNNGTDVFVHDRITGQTTRVSVASGGRQANYESNNPFISADGRYVTFYSEASNLVPEDTNEIPDIFVHDRTTGQTTRVSVASDGSEGNDQSYYPSISADGRYVAFSSDASNLVPGDTNWQGDIFIHDRTTGQTTRVSVASDGSEGNSSSFYLSISADGQYVAIGSYASNLVPGDTNNGTDVFVHDRTTGQTTRVNVASDGSQANNHSYNLSISADGRYVAFSSEASNLVPGDTNGAGDIFVAKYSPPPANYRPVITLLGDNPMSIEQGSAFTDPGATATDAEDGDISSKIDVSDTVNTSIVGKTTLTYTVTDSQGLTSTPVVRTVIVTRMKTSPERVSVSTDGSQGTNGSSYHCSDLAWRPSISADGRYVAFIHDAPNLAPGDTNGTTDVFVHDRTTDQTTRVSVTSDGSEANRSSYYPSISADGRYVAFSSEASNLAPGDTNGQGDIFIHDRTTGQTTRVSVTSDGSEAGGGQTPSISADGRYVAFSSYASNLVQGDTNGKNDIFVHDRTTGQTTRVSVASDGSQANNNSYYPSISADGRYVAFFSAASNLVPGDTNGFYDVFVHDRTTGQTTRVSVASDGSQANGAYGDSWSASISADGRYVVFGSRASNLVPGDTNESFDNFVHDRTTGQTTRVSDASDGLNPSISADGRYVAFGSGAIDAINVHDRMTGQTIRVSDASDGSLANNASCHPSISADGRYVAFGSDASNLVPADTNGAWDFFEAKHSPPPANYRPVITLLGDNPMSINQGSAFTDPGATATDPEDGDISNKIHVEVNTSIAGKMTLTYTVTDSQGLASTPMVRTVIIIPLKVLSVYLYGSGTGIVNSAPSGINCKWSWCSGSYPSGTTVTLTANAADGSTFAGWWGSGCDGPSNCVVKMDTNPVVHAVFELKTYSVSGRVTDSITGLPLSGVKIYLSGPNLTGWNTITDANGDYTLSGLQHKINYTLGPYKPGYGFSPSRTISISSNTTGINFQGGAIYSVSGRVIDGSGNPIPAAMVLTDNGQSILTNNSGSFTLSVMAGSRTFTISKAGYTFVPVFLRVSVSANISGLNFTGYDKPPIVMVHGWNSNAEGTFKEGSGPNVPDALVQAGYHVEFANLYTKIEYTPKLDDNVPRLVEAIDRAKAATGQPKVILIAHSMGGLVSRHYIEGDSYDCNDPKKRCDVSALFTFGSPHSGVAVRDYLSLGSAPGGPAIYDMSEEGTRIFNATYSRRAGVDYHLIGGDAPMDSEIILHCNYIWGVPYFCWPEWRPISRSLAGWTGGLLIDGQDDAFVSTDSATGLAGWADRASTDEVHGSLFGDRTYFNRQGDLSRSYYQCLKKVLVDKTATTCGQWSDKDRVPTTTAAAVGLKAFGASVKSSSQKTEKSPPSLGQQTPIATGTLLAGQKKNHTLLIEGGTTVFTAHWTSGSVAVTLIDPNGQTIDPAFAASHPDMVTYRADNNTVIYYFRNAIAGKWQLLLQGGSITAEGSNYSAFAAFQSTLRISSQMDRVWYAPSDTAYISAEFSEAPSSANVTATLLYSDGSSNVAILSPNGQGQYEASFAVVDVPGYTQGRLEASGIKADGAPFERGQDLQFQISPHSAVFTGIYRDYPEPRPEDPSLYQALDVTVGINSAINGRIGLSADLVDASGKFVAHSMAIEGVAVGASNLVLRFSGADIFAAQSNEPYHLINLLLTDQREATLVITEAQDAYTTSVYDYRTFAERHSFPTVGIGGPYSVSEGDSITLTALGNDPENDPIAFVWDLDDDGIFETPGQSVTFSAEGINSPRVYIIRVQAIDSNGFSAIDQTTLDVMNVAPVVYAGSDTTIQPDEIFSGSGTFTDSGTDTWTATVDYGDDTGVQSLTLTGTNFELNHLYSEIGVYPVTVTVSDNDDGVGKDIVTVTVSTIPGDLDGDGVADEADACPYSDLSATVVIGNCDTGVRNPLDTNGCTIFDRIAKCAVGVKNHGQFSSCVSKFTENLKKDGIITGSEKGSIQRCAEQVKIP